MIFRCLRALEILEHEYCYLKNKLHELFQVIINTYYHLYHQTIISLYITLVIDIIFFLLYVVVRAAASFGSWSEISDAKQQQQYY